MGNCMKGLQHQEGWDPRLQELLKTVEVTEQLTSSQAQSEPQVAEDRVGN